jgi:hypothetical protein
MSKPGLPVGEQVDDRERDLLVAAGDLEFLPGAAVDEAMLVLHGGVDALQCPRVGEHGGDGGQDPDLRQGRAASGAVPARDPAPEDKVRPGGSPVTM